MGKFYGRRMVPEYLIKKLENGPVKLTTSGSIKDLTTKEINELKAGDIVLKTTGNQKHAYIVSYKEEGQGICLTYTDASCVETVSFDYTDGEWVYNSTDVTDITSGAEYTAGTGIEISEQDVISIDTETVALKTDIPTVNHLYKHSFLDFGLVVITNDNTTYTGMNLALKTLLQADKMYPASAMATYTYSGNEYSLYGIYIADGMNANARYIRWYEDNGVIKYDYYDRYIGAMALNSSNYKKEELL